MSFPPFRSCFLQLNGPCFVNVSVRVRLAERPQALSVFEKLRVRHLARPLADFFNRALTEADSYGVLAGLIW
jgi:hypothetical protein